jgi:hypothetical protein
MDTYHGSMSPMFVTVHAVTARSCRSFRAGRLAARKDCLLWREITEGEQIQLCCVDRKRCSGML